jgi:tRNA threonylcarbamoyladenosine biosynthesis protein TsaE
MSRLERQKKKTFISESAERTLDIGVLIGGHLAKDAIVSLEGPLGSGKTTLVKGIARALGVRDIVTSPTFTIVSVYEGDVSLIHIDLYRIAGTAEVDDLGIDDLLSAGGVKLIEWGDRAAGLLPPRSMRILIRFSGEARRHITVLDGRS